MRACIVWLLLWIAGTAPLVAAQEPLRVSLVGTMRPLSVPGAQRYEHELVRHWAQQLGRPVQLVERRDQADVWMGPLDQGLAYYKSEPAALTWRQGGVADLRKLAGQTFCIVEGSPYGAVFAERFQASAKTYPSSAHALAGLRRKQCIAVIEDRLLLEHLLNLPEWQGCARTLPPLPELAITFRVLAEDVALQSALQPLVDRSRLSQAIGRKWLNEVAFEARMLAEGSDCP